MVTILRIIVKIAAALIFTALVFGLIYLGLKDSEKLPEGALEHGVLHRKKSPLAGSAILMCKAPTHPVNPMIYGIAYVPRKEHKDKYFWKMNPGARRWGGNSASRFNWKLGNAWNTANDWFFMNVNYSADPSYHWSRFLLENNKHHVATALTIPMLGWVAKDTSSYSFSVKTFGKQQAVDPLKKDAGNGIDLNGEKITPGRQEITSQPFTPKDAAGWVAEIKRLSLRVGNRLVHMYILGNEPMLWNDTHRDVRKKPLGYDELLSRTIQYGHAIRRIDKDALIAGPALWGWPAYFYSAIDMKKGIRFKPDRRRHDDTPFIQWFLQKLKEHEEKTGERILDVLDVHFYPQAKGVYKNSTNEQNSENAALRLRTTRALWDPDYRDESWIDANIQLLPRLSRLIAKYYSGLKISIGEYSFGAENDMSGALAQAEVLGRFSQTPDLISAFYWTYPPDGSPLFWAFVAFRNYDGKGSAFLEESVQIKKVRNFSFFASTDSKKEKYVLIALNFNQHKSMSVSIDTGTCGTFSLNRVFQYKQGLSQIKQLVSPDIAIKEDKLNIVLAPYSITIVELKTKIN
jgi:hypothetical protein